MISVAGWIDHARKMADLFQRGWGKSVCGKSVRGRFQVGVRIKYEVTFSILRVGKFGKPRWIRVSRSEFEDEIASSLYRWNSLE
jgi:hypothetical protein